MSKSFNYLCSISAKYLLILSFLFVSFSSIANGFLDSINLHFNVAMNANFSSFSPLNRNFVPIIYNFPHEVQGFATLDESKFSSDDKYRTASFYLPISLQVGYRKMLDINSNVQIELGLTNMVRRSNSSERLRFSDQIDGQQGFVQPTEFYLEDSYFRSTLLNVSVGYERVLKEGHFVSTKIGILSLLESAYFLNLKDASDNKYDYEDNDLSFNDGFIVPQMSVRYAYELNRGDVSRRVFGEVTMTSRSERMTMQTATISCGLQFVFLSKP